MRSELGRYHPAALRGDGAQGMRKGGAMGNRQRRRTRPHVEALEDRWLPATPVVSSPRLPTVRLRPAALSEGLAEERLLKLTNELRQRQGLPRVTQFAALMRAARVQARLLASLDLHAPDPNVHAVGGGVGARARRAGYLWRGVGENVYSTNDLGNADVLVGRALRNWLASATHRVNLLDPAFREVGVGVSRSAGGIWQVVVLFGTRS